MTVAEDTSFGQSIDDDCGKASHARAVADRSMLIRRAPVLRSTLVTMMRWCGAALLAAWLGGSATACAPDDPFDFGGPRSCEAPDQNEWVYRLMQHAYLWADELPAVDPLEYESPGGLVADLRVGHDRWSRVSNKARTTALFQEGKVVGLGFRTRRDAHDRVVVATVDASTPAAAAGLQRGDVIRAIGGLATEQIDEQRRWGDVYGESEPGVTVELELERQDGQVRRVQLVKDWVSLDTVPETRVLRMGDHVVGYVAFATFVDTSVAALDTAFAQFRRAGVRTVVVDLRYNGGGLIAVARHFMHLLVGAVAEGKVAYHIRYNDELSAENDDRRLMRIEHSLPRVDHVAFITTGSTLSASELLINAVAAHVPVSVIGETTGGKPVGSRHFDFCDQIVAPITFRLLNANDRGDYFDGLRPTCRAPDDLTRPLGSEDEAALAVALHRIATGECLPMPGGEGAVAPPPAGLRTSPAATASHDAVWHEWPELGGLQ
jgi:carboxyl-terminal processing protease